MVESYDYPRFKVAAVQASSVIRDAPQWFDLESSLDKATSLISEAGRNGARLIVFPETWLPCFPYWSLDVMDRAIFNEIWAQYLHSSVEVPSQDTETLCKAAKKANAYVAMGINERDKIFPGRMYNSILYISPRGEIIGTHRKICNTVQERLFHTPGDGGDNLKAVYQTELGKLGGSICGEHQQLTLQYNWIMQGIQIHCSLWPGTEGLETVTDLLTRAICRIGHTFGVLSAAYFPEQSLPKKFSTNCLFNRPGLIRGGSGVVNPNGEYIAGPVYDEETIVYGDIDLSEIDKTRAAVDLSGIYGRWDLININVRQEPYEPVVSMEMVEKSTSGYKQIKDLEMRLKQLEQHIAALSSEIAKNGKVPHKS